MTRKKSDNAQTVPSRVKQFSIEKIERPAPLAIGLSPGDSARYIAPSGEVWIGTVINCLPAVLMDINSGEQFDAVKFVIYDERRKRTVTTPAVRRHS